MKDQFIFEVEPLESSPEFETFDARAADEPWDTEIRRRSLRSRRMRSHRPAARRGLRRRGRYARPRLRQRRRYPSTRFPIRRHPAKHHRPPRRRRHWYRRPHPPVVVVEQPAAEPPPPEQGTEYIRWVQSALNQILGRQLLVNGIAGPETRDAVREFQSRQRLPVNGFVGPRTEQALVDALSGQGPKSGATSRGTRPTPARPNSEIELMEREWQSEVNRRSRAYIRWVQKGLNKILGLKLAVDGIMGPKTRSAMRRFQQRSGLTVDGIVGPQTERALISAGAGAPPQITVTTRPKTRPQRENKGIISVPIEQMVPGIDVSHWQGQIDWARVVGAGIRFAYIKATQGTTGRDKPFQRNWEEAKANGIVRGAYHFLMQRSSSSVETQAQNFLQTVALSPGDMPPALDVETRYVERIIAEEGLQNAWKFIYRWVEIVKRETGYTPVLYMSTRGASRLKHNFGKLPSLTLWIPRYPKGKPSTQNLPPLPVDALSNLVWKKWTFWQYTSKGRVAGIPSRVDLNLFNGNGATFNRWLRQVQPRAKP